MKSVSRVMPFSESFSFQSTFLYRKTTFHDDDIGRNMINFQYVVQHFEAAFSMQIGRKGQLNIGKQRV
jgi:hypothetical protein